MQNTRALPLTTLVLASFATIGLAGCDIDVSLDGATTTRTEEITMPVDAIRLIDVDTENGEVSIRGGDGDEITIRSVFRERHEGDADSSIEVDDDRLVIDGECDGHHWGNCSVGFVVTVPSDVDVRVTTANGRIDVSDIGGDVELETDNGAIEAIGLRSSTVTSSSDNGRVRLSFDESPRSVTTHSDNGTISLRVPDGDESYLVEADSDNGSVDIDVRTDPTADHRLVATSDNGSIDIGYRTI